ncbi:formin-binding protein 1-like isoform X2 [Cimex lectularius]|uniref:Formin-binding protein 1-like n=1 Tax=Cimex lectularius TaxID=79782 RepID=A0A8I6SP25_CIMLE|nr:formin-binding protein 1-like isoform X2 [Cimex lectularius]
MADQKEIYQLMKNNSKILNTYQINCPFDDVIMDQFENLSAHTLRGIDFLDKYNHFIRERSMIEVEYAAKLRGLVKRYQPKKKEEEDYQYSPCKAFKSVMNEVNDLAGQHEVIAENLQLDVVKEISILWKDLKDERKKLLAEGNRMVANLNQQITSLERSRKNYEKASKEAEKATDSFKRADADYNLSRAEVEKQKMNMTIKSQQFEDAKNEYANQLQRTNEQQKQHYKYLMPEIFRQLQELDEKRIRNIRNFMIQSVEVERKVFPIINQCLDGIITAAKTIHEKEDTLLVIERYKSGFETPGDFPFDDLSKPDGNQHTPTIHTSLPIKPEATTRGTLSASKLRKRVGLFGIFSSNKNNLSGNGDNKDDYSDLPPNQRRKKLQSKIDEIQSKIHQESAARDGLMKMKGVYEQNSTLGDPMTIEGQLNDSSHRLDKLRQDLHKYQSYLEDNQNDTSLHNGVCRQHSWLIPVEEVNRNSWSLPVEEASSSRNSGGSGGDDDSLSRSASDSSVSANHNHNHINKQSAPGTPLPSHVPESGIGASHSSLPESDDPPPPYYETELLPSLGTCKALYSFDATSEGSMAMVDGEELLIIEVDQGDGWTRVRRPVDLTEGFVPTSYLQCFLNNY